jgi:alpha-L-fucosidase
VELPAGRYRLQTISDDAVRVWVDGRLAIDAWEPHESRVDEVRISGGRHELVVEYFQVDGWVELSLDIQPVRSR